MQMLPSIFYQEPLPDQHHHECPKSIKQDDDNASQTSDGLMSTQSSEPSQMIIQRRPKKQFGFALLTIMFALMLTHCDFSSLEGKNRRMSLSIETQAGYLTTFYQIFEPLVVGSKSD